MRSMAIFLETILIIFFLTFVQQTEHNNSVKGRKAAQKLLEPKLSIAEQWAEMCLDLAEHLQHVMSLMRYAGRVELLPAHYLIVMMVI